MINGYLILLRKDMSSRYPGENLYLDTEQKHVASKRAIGMIALAGVFLIAHFGTVEGGRTPAYMMVTLNTVGIWRTSHRETAVGCSSP